MQLVDQEVKVWGECPTGITEAKKWIERAGRVCYASEVVNDDPDVFLNKVMSNDPPHSSMFEHSNLVLDFSISALPSVAVKEYLDKYKTRWITFDKSRPRIYGNCRAFMEATKTKSIDSLMSVLTADGFTQATQTSRAQKRVTVELHTDRNILAEITRHRDDVGFSVRSQRYVDETGRMEFVKPSWYDQAPFIQQETFRLSCEQAELNYLTLRKAFPPQHARTVLNGQCKTVIVMTAYLPEWDWIFKLRRASGAYPQMIKLMNMVYDQFKERGYVDAD